MARDDRIDYDAMWRELVYDRVGYAVQMLYWSAKIDRWKRRIRDLMLACWRRIGKWQK